MSNVFQLGDEPQENHSAPPPMQIPPRFFHKNEIIKDAFNAMVIIDPQSIGAPPPPDGMVYAQFMSRMLLISTPSQAISNMKRLGKEQDPNWVLPLDQIITLRRALYPLLMPSPVMPFTIREENLVESHDAGCFLTAPSAFAAQHAHDEHNDPEDDGDDETAPDDQDRDDDENADELLSRIEQDLSGLEGRSGDGSEETSKEDES